MGVIPRRESITTSLRCERQVSPIWSIHGDAATSESVSVSDLESFGSAPVGSRLACLGQLPGDACHPYAHDGAAEPGDLLPRSRRCQWKLLRARVHV